MNVERFREFLISTYNLFPDSAFEQIAINNAFVKIWFDKENQMVRKYQKGSSPQNPSRVCEFINYKLDEPVSEDIFVWEPADGAGSEIPTIDYTHNLRDIRQDKKHQRLKK